MYYVALSRNVGIAWANVEARHPATDRDAWFRRFSENAGNHGYLGQRGRLVHELTDAQVFGSEDDAHDAMERSRFAGDDWDGLINPL